MSLRAKHGVQRKLASCKRASEGLHAIWFIHPHSLNEVLNVTYILFNRNQLLNVTHHFKLRLPLGRALQEDSWHQVTAIHAHIIIYIIKYMCDYIWVVSRPTRGLYCRQICFASRPFCLLAPQDVRQYYRSLRMSNYMYVRNLSFGNVYW